MSNYHVRFPGFPLIALVTSDLVFGDPTGLLASLVESALDEGVAFDFKNIVVKAADSAEIKFEFCADDVWEEITWSTIRSTLNPDEVEELRALIKNIGPYD